MLRNTLSLPHLRGGRRNHVAVYAETSKRTQDRFEKGLENAKRRKQAKSLL